MFNLTVTPDHPRPYRLRWNHHEVACFTDAATALHVLGQLATEGDHYPAGDLRAAVGRVDDHTMHLRPTGQVHLLPVTEREVSTGDVRTMLGTMWEETKQAADDLLDGDDRDDDQAAALITRMEVLADLLDEVSAAESVPHDPADGPAAV